MYKVIEQDLIGHISGFPIEIVQKMVDYQVEQGNQADVTVFQDSKTWNLGTGGFDWTATDVKEDRSGRINFWSSIINHRNWGTFFNRFPKYPKVENTVKEEVKGELPDIDFMTDQPYVTPVKGVNVDLSDDTVFENPFESFETTPEELTPEVGDVIIVSDHKFGTCERVFIAKVDSLDFPIITVTKEAWNKLSKAKGNAVNAMIGSYKNYKPISKEVIVKLTLEDISKGKGVGVAPHLIKIVK